MPGAQRSSLVASRLPDQMGRGVVADASSDNDDYVDDNAYDAVDNNDE